MEKKHKYPPGNFLIKGANYAWHRFLFGKTQISSNHKKSSYVPILPVP